MRISKALLVLLSFVLSMSFSIGQGQNFKFKHYSVEEGLPQSQVYALLEGSNGYLWLGTKGGGLTKFNGKKFTSLTTDDGLISNQVFALFQDSQDQIWIGTNRGVSTYNGIEFTNHELPVESPVISSIIEDNSGTIWVASHLGLFYKKGNDWSRVIDPNNRLRFDISCLFLDKDGTLWTGNDNGLFQIDTDSKEIIKTQTTKNGLTSNKVRSIVRYNGKLLIGTYGQGLNRETKNGWMLQGPKKRIVHHIHLDKESNVWISTQNFGVIKINGSNWTEEVFDDKHGLTANHARVTIQDTWGNFWIGTSGGGICKYHGEIFSNYNIPDGYPGNKFYSVLCSRDNSIWTGVDGYGVMQKIGDSIVTYDASNGFKNAKCKTLFEDKLGNIWIGTEGMGVFIYDGRKFKQYTGDNGLADNWIRRIVQDQNMNIWIATVNGISKFSPIKYSNLTFRVTNYRKALPDRRINAMCVDHLNRIWFGTKKGQVGYIYNERVTVFDANDGIKKAVIKSIAEDQLKRLWVGTEGEGIFYADLTSSFITFNQLSKKDGLNSNNVYLLDIDKKGQIWAGAGSGVDRISFGDQGELKNIKHYDKSTGFLGGETCTNAIDISNQGEVWIGTLNGLNGHNPSHQRVNVIPPTLGVNDILSFYESISTKEELEIGNWFRVKDPLHLKHAENHIGFNFEGVNLLNPDEVYYRFKLKGMEDKWSPITQSTNATYSNLGAGNYVFQVIAGNEDNVWTDPVEIPFSIAQPFYLTWWFIGICILVISSVTYYTYQSRVLAEKQKIKAAKEKLEIERNMIEMEQKALRLQMNPHFIFNAMNTVQALIGKQDTKSARYYIAKFSKLMRKVLDNSRHQIISIQDEIEALDNYLNLEQVSHLDSFDYEINIDEQIEPDAFGIPPMLLQPFAENAIVHGLKEIEHRGKITIDIEWNENHIKCMITDNGRGRSAAKEVRQQQSSYHKSTALILTQERLAVLTNEIEEQAFEIIDLENPTGTRIIIRIPIIEIF